MPSYPRKVQWVNAGKMVTLDLVTGKQSSRPAPKGRMAAQSDSFEVVEHSTTKPKGQRVVLGGKMDAVILPTGKVRMVRKLYAPEKPKKKRKRSKPMGRNRARGM